MPSAKCLIYERDVTGHRLHHVRHLTDALLEIGCEVAVALQADARSRDEFKVHLEPLESHFKLLARLNPQQPPGYFATARRVDELLEVIALERPDWVYVPYADIMTQAAAVRTVLYGNGELRGTPIEGQVMRGRYAYPPISLRDSIGGATSRWLMRHSPWRVTHLLDTWVYNNLQGSTSSTEFRLIPEPVEPLPQLDRMEARRALKIPAEGRYVATIGGLEPRKGIDLLLAAFARAKLQQDDRLLLVGKMSQPMRDLIAREYSALLSTGRLVVVDRYVSDFELGCGFLAGDVLVTPHPRQVGSSGTLVRAAAANRPIISSDFGWVGWATETFRLGATVNVSNIDRYAAATTDALENACHYRRSGVAERFCQFHTIANQKAHWVAEIGAVRGLPLGTLAKRLEWSWVLEAIETKQVA